MYTTLFIMAILLPPFCVWGRFGQSLRQAFYGCYDVLMFLYCFLCRPLNEVDGYLYPHDRVAQRMYIG